MTSSETASSRPTPYNAVRFPPRAELPRGVVIPVLPALGTTWYERGISYWARRTGVLLVLIAVVAIYVAIISGVVRAAGPPGSPGFLTVLTVEAVFTLVSGVLMVRHFWRAGVSGQLANGKPGKNRGVGGGLGLLAASAGPVGAFLIVASAVLTAGGILAVAVLWLVPALPAEQYARRQLAEALRQNRQAHSEHPVANQRSKHHGSH
jgi:hypothetical protein